MVELKNGTLVTEKAVVVESLAGDLCQEGGCSMTPLFYEGWNT